MAQAADPHSQAGRNLAATVLLLNSINAYAGYVGGWRLLEKRELMDGEAEGFRLFWRDSRSEWVDIVRETNGAIRVTSTASDFGGRYQFDERIENPSDGTIRVYDLAIEYALLN